MLSHFFIEPREKENQILQTPLWKMEAAFHLKYYAEASEYGALVLAEVELDKKYYTTSLHEPLSILEVIASKEKKALHLIENINKNHLPKNFLGPTPRPHFIKEATFEISPTEHIPAEKMEASFNAGKYQQALAYSQLTLEEIGIDKKYYVQDRLFVPDDIKTSINLKGGKACLLLGHLYGQGLVPGSAKDIAIAEAYYNQAKEDFNCPEAENYLSPLSHHTDSGIITREQFKR